jgi:hypothetical protein
MDGAWVVGGLPRLRGKSIHKMYCNNDGDVISNERITEVSCIVMANNLMYNAQCAMDLSGMWNVPISIHTYSTHSFYKFKMVARKVIKSARKERSTLPLQGTPPSFNAGHPAA